MIDTETLRRGPHKPKQPLRILTEEAVRKALTAKVEIASAYTRQIIGLRGLLHYDLDTYKRIALFHMHADDKMSKVSNAEEIIGKFERGRFQKLAFTIMTAYGLNPDISRPTLSSEMGFDSQGTASMSNGTSRQFLDYPSQTIPGLYFERWIDFTTESGAPIFVSWTAVSQKRPFREHFRNLLPKPLIRVEI